MDLKDSHSNREQLSQIARHVRPGSRPQCKRLLLVLHPFLRLKIKNLTADRSEQYTRKSLSITYM